MQTTTDTTTAPVLATDDPRTSFGRAVAIATATVEGVRPDQLDHPTPCEGMDVRDMLAHLVSALGMVEALATGGDAMAVHDEPLRSGFAGAWSDAADRARAAWSDDAVLERPMALPWQQGTGADLLLGYVNEIVVHTWDVAVATQQSPEWEDEIVRLALDRMPGLPAEGRREMFEQISADMGLDEVAVPFAEVVPLPDDAPAIDRLVAWNGRDPGWTPPRG